MTFSALSLLLVIIKLCEESPTGTPFRVAQILAGACLAIIGTLIPRRPDVFTPEGKLVDLENTVCAWGKYSMNWCTSALVLAAKSDSLEEFPVLNYNTRSKSQPSLLRTSAGGKLFYRIFLCHIKTFFKQWGFTSVRAVLTFAHPYCFSRLLKSIEDNQGRKNDAWFWLAAMGASAVVLNILTWHLVLVQWLDLGTSCAKYNNIC